MIEALAEIRKEAQAAWEATKPSDTSARERLYAQVKAVALFETKLREYIATGKLSTEKLSQWQKIRQKAAGMIN